MTPYPIILFGVLAAVAAAPDAPADLAESRARQQSTQGNPAEPADLPVSLERIQKKLMRDPAIKVDKLPAETGRGRPTFRIQVDAPKLTAEEILGPDFLRSPVPATGTTHLEFQNIVTPTDVRGYDPLSNLEGVTA